jgi:hypothetical protein
MLRTVAAWRNCLLLCCEFLSSIIGQAWQLRSEAMSLVTTVYNIQQHNANAARQQ